MPTFLAESRPAAFVLRAAVITGLWSPFGRRKGDLAWAAALGLTEGALGLTEDGPKSIAAGGRPLPTEGRPSGRMEDHGPDARRPARHAAGDTSFLLRTLRQEARLVA